MRFSSENKDILLAEVKCSGADSLNGGDLGGDGGWFMDRLEKPLDR